MHRSNHRAHALSKDQEDPIRIVCLCRADGVHSCLARINLNRPLKACFKHYNRLDRNERPRDW